MKRNLSSLSIVALLVLFSSCKKGDDGPPGTANVKYSEWFTVNTWQKDTVFSVWGFHYIKDAPDITQEILDKGTVITFGRLRGYNALVWKEDEVAQLPITLTYLSGNVTTDTWSAKATPAKLKIRFVNDRNTYTSIASNHQFRYIIIPGGLPAGRGISFTYEDICRIYNIPE